MLFININKTENNAFSITTVNTADFENYTHYIRYILKTPLPPIIHVCIIMNIILYLRQNLIPQVFMNISLFFHFTSTMKSIHSWTIEIKIHVLWFYPHLLLSRSMKPNVH